MYNVEKGNGNKKTVVPLGVFTDPSKRRVQKDIDSALSYALYCGATNLGSLSDLFTAMPQHKSAEKRVRQNAKRQARNRMHRSRMRSMIKQLEQTEDRAKAEELLPKVKAKIDRLAGKGLLHQNKAARYKSRLEKHVSGLE